MSTRATYLFKGSDYRPDVCFYVHYDGYPEGAAGYFRAMLNVKNERGGLAARFIRDNAYAEFTKSHEHHGDTEFRYTIHPDGRLEAWHRPLRPDDAGFNSIGTWDHVALFVNQYDKDEPPFIRLETRYRHAFWLEEPKALEFLLFTTYQALIAAVAQGLSANAVSKLEEVIHLAKLVKHDALGLQITQYLEDAKSYDERLKGMTIDELEGFCCLNNLAVPQRPSFGDVRCSARAALVGLHFRNAARLKTYRVRIKSGFPTEYEVPEGIDPLEWINWGKGDYGHEGYSRDDIEILGVTAPPDKRIAA